MWGLRECDINKVTFMYMYVDIQTKQCVHYTEYILLKFIGLIFKQFYNESNNNPHLYG